RTIRYVGRIPAEAKAKPALVVGAVQNPALEREIVVMTFDEATPAQDEELGR
ncbi:MAG: hypothetical protein GWN58_22045, partial [Anaerolineae bacterium]|nr:hypothetical protein [Anaerolineae bacterium]